ncbi:MAG: cation:proton antiporter [Planctomycetota bacterium]
MDAAIGLAVVLMLGVGAQWVAWRARIPSILILLLCGFLVGPISTLLMPSGEPLLRPDALFGDILTPLVGLSVGLILYEGGLTLRLREIQNTRRVLLGLCTIGAAVTWVLSAFLAWLLIDGMSVGIASLFGAILIVTGPTVIGPLLGHIRPTGPSAAVLKWEGIVIDPIGATAAVLVFEVIAAVSTPGGDPARDVTMAILKTIVIGGGLGFAAAMLLKLMVGRYWVPEFLQNPVSLMLAVAVFAVCDEAQKESGLLATTVMGIVLANQRSADIRHIVEFKENLRVLLISSLFIVLGARLELDALRMIGPGSLVFVALLILVIRPASVFASTARTPLTVRDKLFLCAMAPRGIVAAAVASIFGLALEELGVAGAELLLPSIFLVIIVTVAFYGLVSPWLAAKLGLADRNPQGVIILGAHPWGRAIAGLLSTRGVKVLVVDSNRENTQAARMDHLAVYRGNALGEHAIDEIDFTGMGRLIALTPNEEVNALACQRFGRAFGRREVYQLASGATRQTGGEISREFRGRTLFGEGATFGTLASRFAEGHVLKATTLSEEFGYENYRMLYGPRSLVVAVLTASGALKINTTDEPLEPEPGDTLIGLVNPDDLLLG